MFTRDTQKQSRRVLRPQLAHLAARARTGPVSGDALNCLSAGMAVFTSGHVAQSLLLAQARTGKAAPTIQGRDAIEALRMEDVQPSIETLMVVSSGTKDRKRFNRARYEQHKADLAAGIKKQKKKKDAGDEAPAAASAAPSKKRSRRAAEE